LDNGVHESSCKETFFEMKRRYAGWGLGGRVSADNEKYAGAERTGFWGKAETTAGK